MKQTYCCKYCGLAHENPEWAKVCCLSKRLDDSNKRIANLEEVLAIACSAATFIGLILFLIAFVLFLSWLAGVL